MTGRSRRRCVRRGGGVGGGREGGTRGGEGRPRSVGAAGGDRARSFDRRDARAGRPPRRRRTALASRLAPRRARPHLYTATKNMSATIANTGASLPVPRFRDMGCSDPPPREAGRFSSAGLVFPLSIASSRASHRPARARNRATRAPNLRTEEAARAKTTRRAGRDPARREGGVRARRGERNTRATQTRPTRPSHEEQRRNTAGSGAPCVTASNFFNRLEHLRAREAAKQVQGVRGLSDLRAREAAIPVQGVRGRARSRNPSQLSSNPAPLAMAYLTFSLIVARLL